MNLIPFLLFCTSSATILQQFQDNGIIYDLFGQGRLIREEMHCRPWSLNLFEYVNGLSTDLMTDFGKTILKRRLYESFANICQGFEVPTDVTEIPPSAKNLTDKFSLRFMDRFEMAWNVQKFERDLRSLFLEHKLNSPFHHLVTENELRLYTASDAMDFSHKTTIFPTKCSVPQMTLNARVCVNISEPALSGPIYAIAHAGEFVNDGQAFVYYEVPQFVLIDGDNATAVDINNCKIMFGTYIYCFSAFSTSCNLLTMENCQLMAISSRETTTFERALGTAHIVATNSDVIDVFGNGTMVSVPSQLFTFSVSYTTKEDGIEMDEARMTPISWKGNFPSILGESFSVLNQTPTPLYRAKRKGVAYLYHKAQSPSFFDGVKDFFLHLV